MRRGGGNNEDSRWSLFPQTGMIAGLFMVTVRFVVVEVSRIDKSRVEQSRVEYVLTIPITSTLNNGL